VAAGAGVAAAAALYLPAKTSTWAEVALYAVPALCAVLAIASWWGRRKHRRARDEARAAPATALQGMPWAEIEQLIVDSFRSQGYAVSEPAGGKRAGRPAQLVLHKSGQTFLVDCRYWTAATVDVHEVSDVLAVIQERSAAGGFIVTTGAFTPDARQHAYGKWLHLVDGPQVHQMLRAAQAAHDPSLAPWEPGAEDPGSSWFAPECPICRSSMVLRTAQRGPNAGTQYWGCSHAPLCKGTRDAV
jgi:restriction system protein